MHVELIAAYKYVGQVVVTMTDKSIVEYSAERKGYHCGYCDSPSTKFTHGRCNSATTLYVTILCIYACLSKVAEISSQMLDRLL